MAVNVEEHRKLIPFDGFIHSTGKDGSLMVTDIHIDPSKLDEYMKIATPVVQNMRAMPECLFCGISQNPQDPGHIRIQHAYTKGTDWFREVSLVHPFLRCACFVGDQACGHQSEPECSY
jgi:hypothetical protein